VRWAASLPQSNGGPAIASCFLQRLSGSAGKPAALGNGVICSFEKFVFALARGAKQSSAGVASRSLDGKDDRRSGKGPLNHILRSRGLTEEEQEPKHLPACSALQQTHALCRRSCLAGRAYRHLPVPPLQEAVLGSAQPRRNVKRHRTSLRGRAPMLLAGARDR